MRKIFLIAITLIISISLLSAQSILVEKNGNLHELNTTIYGKRGKVIGQIDTVYFTPIYRTIFYNDSTIKSHYIITEVEATIFYKIKRSKVDKFIRCSIIHLINDLPHNPIIRIQRGYAF